MSLVYSLKLFGNNWAKALKLFLYYIIVWGVCICLLLPCFFAFKNTIVDGLASNDISKAFSGVFLGTLGKGLHNIAVGTYSIFLSVLNSNLALVIYGLFVLFVLMPFFMNIGKYTFCNMLYYYMTSKSEVGFCGTLVKSLKHSTCFAACKVAHNLVFLSIVFVSTYALALIENTLFAVHFLPWAVLLLFVLVFTINQILVLGWCPAMIVFNCNVFVAYKRGFKAVKRHFFATLGTTVLFFVLFWALIFIFGVFTMVVLVPLMTILLCIYNMVTFFMSQGMRFYVNATNIMIPKKLEEVDNINKTAFIL